MENLLTVAYLAAAVLFILSLAGLSNQTTAQRGNSYGMAGMAIAVLATLLHDRIVGFGFGAIGGALVVGGTVGALLAARVAMTSMPELVALLHSFVGLAAVLVFAGAKMIASRWIEVPSLVSVGIIVLCIGAAIWPSVRHLRRAARGLATT